MISESAIMKQIRQAVNLDGRVRIVRNNTGVGRALHSDAKIRFGLGNGGADLVGIIRATGRVFALEVKTEIGRLKPDQVAWLAAVRRFNGFAAVARSKSDALSAVDRACDGALE